MDDKKPRDEPGAVRRMAFLAAYAITFLLATLLGGALLADVIGMGLMVIGVPFESAIVISLALGMAGTAALLGSTLLFYSRAIRK
jgi:nitrate reductase gamma subunit